MLRPFRPWRRFTAPSALLLGLAACAVGPDYQRPETVGKTAAYQSGAAAGSVHAAPQAGRAGNPQTLDSGAPVEGAWWRLFGVPDLDDLVARALAGNPSIQSAKATLAAARENTRVQKAPLFPSISGEFDATRNKTARSLSPVPNNNAWLYNLHTLQLDIAYTPDLWGGTRRGIEQARAQAEAQRFEFEAITNTLINNLVLAVLQQASAQAQIDETRRIIDGQKHLLDILEGELRLGDTSLATVTAQRATLAQSMALLPALRLQHEQAHDQIAALIGATPDTPLPEPRLEAFHLPSHLPVSLPAQLLDQRPDVRAAEALVHAASAAVGIAIANRLPNVQLTAFPGQAVNAMGQFFTPGFGNWQIAGIVTQPIFEGFALMHLERASRDALMAQTETYRDTVLQAVRDVADTLHALHDDADTLAASTIAATSAEHSLSIARRQIGQGDLSTALLLSVEQAALQARLGLITAQTSRFTDSVALFQAVGGGWWNRTDDGEKKPADSRISALKSPN